MSLVHRLATVLFTATAAIVPVAVGASGCAQSETVVALTINPDQITNGPIIDTVKVQLSRGSLKESATLDAPQPAENEDPSQMKSPSFYHRFVVDGWEGKVKVKADGLLEGEIVESGEAEVIIEANTATAAAVTLKTDETVQKEEAEKEAAANAAGAGGCSCPCGAGGAGGAGGSSDSAAAGADGEGGSKTGKTTSKGAGGSTDDGTDDEGTGGDTTDEG